MKLAARIFANIFLFLVSLIFFASAIFKIFSLEVFEFYFVQIGIASWRTAPFIARFFIGVELVVAIFLLLRIHLRQTLIFTIAFLIFLSVYLVVTEILNFSNVNCGCFGHFFIISPINALFKNLLLIVVLILIYIYRSQIYTLYVNKFFSFLLLSVSLLSPYVFAPIFFDKFADFDDFGNKYSAYSIEELKTIWHSNYPDDKFAQGKWCVLFASATCQHCINAAYKLRILSQKFPQMQLAFFINGKKQNIEIFLLKSNSSNIRYIKTSAKTIIDYTDGKLPTIFLISDNVLKAKISNYYSIDNDFIRKWLEIEE